MDLLLILSGVLIICILYALFEAYTINNHWKNLGIPYAKPLLFFGNSLDFILQRKTSGEKILEISKKFPKSPLFGFYQFTRPVLIVQDQDLVERVLIKDFQHFTDHGFYVDEDATPFDANLFNMAGEKWRAMRKKLSPVFTSGKLKLMSKQMTEISSTMIQRVESKKLEDVELKDILERLTMDIIGSCGFGINPGALVNDNSEFKEIASKVFQISGLGFIKLLFLTIFPKWARALSITVNNPRVIRYFTKLVKETMANRIESDEHRNDFVQLMITLKEKGFIEITSRDFTDEYLKLDVDNSKDKEIIELTSDKIVGQSLIFLTAGFETATVTMLYLCYDLSLHQDAQDKLRKEITDAVEEHGGGITYESTKSMPFLEMCLKESMRLHPVAQALVRVCTKEYTFPGTNVKIQPGQQVFVPTLVIHNDPNIYPEPEKYIPHRFAPENDTRPNCSFLGFGDGPRICIAMRFALTEMKIAMAHLLLHFRISLSPKTKPLVTNKRSIVAEPKDKVMFNLERV